MACLCAPTSHEGSFRCRLHRTPNPIINPDANHPIKAVNYCANGSNSTSNQIGCIPYYITVRESSGLPAAAPHPFVGDNVRFSHSPQVAADRLNHRMRSSLPLDTFASSSSSLSPKSPSHRLPSSSSYSSSAFSSSSSSRASASSSSPSPSSPFSCTRPPPAAKRLSSSSSSPSKSPFRVSSPPASSSWFAEAAVSNITPSASHAAAMAIMKQHSHSKHGARAHNRNALSPTSKIGPSRLSRMAVACADERPILKEDQHYISGSHQHGSAPASSISSSFADNPMQSGLASVETAQIKAAQMGLKMCSAINKFKQNESSCRIVGSKEGSLIMPTVY